MDNFNYFMPFGKTEKLDDGSRLVSGYASTPRLDLDGEIITSDAVKKALPGYMEWRNIRQMHQPIAVGTAKEAHIDDEGLYITGKIVDPECIKLIDEGVLKGFSIGGKKLAKKGNTITDIELVEISVVDRPANPDCRFEIQKAAKPGSMTFGKFAEADMEPTENEVSWLRKMFERLAGNSAPVHIQKAFIGNEDVTDQLDYDDAEYVTLSKREFSTKERESAAESGEAMPGGGYPIKSTTDLHNAIQAFGRAKNKEATKKHIIRRARALGATDKLPEGWIEEKKPAAKTASAVLLLADDPLFGGTGMKKMLNDPLFGGTGEDPLFGYETPPVLVDLLKTSFGPHLVPDDGMRDRLVKGCGVVADLAYAFSSIREAQRRLVGEGFIEKDGDDHAMALKLGEIASELAAVMAQKAEHEGSEARYLTDADDITSYLMREGVSEMGLKTDDLNKGAKANFGKASQHLMKAGKAHADMMECMGKLAAMHGGFVRKAAAAEALGKGGDGMSAPFDHGAAMKLLKEAHGHATEAADHMEMAHGLLGKGAGEEDTAANAAAGNKANGTNIGEWGGSSTSAVGESERTEGDVPWYTATEPYAGKAAGARQAGGIPEGYISKREADLMAENAALKARQEALSKTPGGVFKGRSIITAQPGDQTGLVENGDDLSVLMKGIDHVDANDPESRKVAGGRMIGNMLANSRKFGKSVFDPNFRGGAGMKR